MKKRLFVLILTLFFAFAAAVCVCASHTGIALTPDSEKLDVLRLLSIMNGDENGDMHLENSVTRAEFVKMAVSASSQKDTVAKASAFSLFPDVTSTHWARGYIAAAINMGLVNGYLDGTFRPENTVTLEEAVTVTLKLLGYTNADFAGTYPDAQLAKYHDIDLDTAINASQGEPMTRKACMKLIYNLLCTETKAGQRYCTTLGVGADTDDTVDYLALLASKMVGPFVNIQNSYQSTVPFALQNDVTVYRDGKRSLTNAVADYDVYYYNETLRAIWCYTDKESGVLSAVMPNREKPTSVVVSGTTYSLDTDEAKRKASYLGDIETDSLVTLLLGKDGGVAGILAADTSVIGDGEGKVSYADVVNATLKGPYIASESASLPADTAVDTATASFYRKNAPASLADMRPYTVYYYSKILNTVWLYDDTVTGVIDSVSPSAASPQSVTVSGKTYSLETSDARFALSTLGTFRVGDRVTLLLGRNGDAAGVVKAGATDIKPVYGVVTATGKGQYTTAEGRSYTADTTTVCTTDGDTFIYEFDGKRLSVGDAVRVDVTDSGTYIAKLSAPRSVSGVVELNEALAAGRFAADCGILDTGRSGVCETVKPSRLVGCTVGYMSVKYFALDDRNAVQTLILDDYTGDLVTYGFITSAEKSETGAFTVKYILNDAVQTYASANSAFSVRYGAAYFIMAGNTVSTMKNIGIQFDVRDLTATYVTDEKNTVYTLSDNVQCYRVSGTTFTAVDLDDICGKGYSITAYCDKKDADGGRVRVLTAR